MSILCGLSDQSVTAVRCPWSVVRCNLSAGRDACPTESWILAPVHWLLGPLPCQSFYYTEIWRKENKNIFGLLKYWSCETGETGGNFLISSRPTSCLANHLRGALGTQGIVFHQIPDSARAGCSAETTANTEIGIYYHFQTIFPVLFLGNGPPGTDGDTNPAITA